MQISKQEFSQRIKSKFPQYSELNDDDLADRILLKFPQYQKEVEAQETIVPDLDQIEDKTLQPEEEVSQEIPKSERIQSLIQETEKSSIRKSIDKPLSLIGFPTRVERLEREKEQAIKQEKLGLSKPEIALDDFKNSLKSSIGDAARFAAFAVPIGKIPKILKAAPKVAKLAFQSLKTSGVVSGSKFVEALSEDGNIEGSAKKALDAGVSAGTIALALPLIGGTVKAASKTLAPLLKPAGKVAKETAAFISETLSSVPQRFYKRALDKELAGESIFRGKWNPRIFQALGGKAQRAMNKIKKLAGEGVGEEKKILSKSKESIDPKPIVNKLDEMVADLTDDGLTALENKDLSFINEIRQLLAFRPVGKKNLSLSAANILKQKINNKLDFNIETVKKPSSLGQGILKRISKIINDEIANKSAGFRIANKKFSEISNLNKRLQSKLKDESVTTKIRNLYLNENKEFVQGLFEELDAVAPKGFKFLNKLKDSVAREPLEKIFPGRQGGSGSAQGIANLFRVGAVAATSKLLLPAFSPLTQKGLIKGITVARKVSPGIGQIVKRGLPPAIGLRQDDSDE